ncbi:MAG: ATP-dependent Clp protease proteolytic subunit [bacterium]|nr:ATP-dependent Clp protease proteolytic subunit [bacterium]
MSKNIWVPDSPNTILFFDMVTADTVQALIADIEAKHRDAKKNKSSVQLLINSTGGDVKSGLAFLYTMQDLGIPLKTYGFGIESAALLLYLAGTNRFADKTKTKFLLHEAKVHLDGEYTAHSASTIVQELENLNHVFAERLVERTSAGEEYIVELMHNETWLSAKQAKVLGIVHEIID